MKEPVCLPTPCTELERWRRWVGSTGVMGEGSTGEGEEGVEGKRGRGREILQARLTFSMSAIEHVRDEGSRRTTPQHYMA
ncbi:hypothetical protein E2C01_058111 [Portunus trituberculatus]|uniref:Uncharacterized protein n=1 Tax=Portunus trituberculatus TaxID=210409 RepID=A0A5B7H1S2_PORTR|nr:hypothetical protein [Portunus trituberculatus]